MNGRLCIAWIALMLCALSSMGWAQDPAITNNDPAVQGLVEQAQALVGQPPDDVARGAEGGRFSTAIEIALLLTALSVLPALLITLTSFTRIVIVLSFVRRSLSMNELPPNPVVIGLALFLTAFVMGPTFERAYEEAYVPYRDGEIGADVAVKRGWGELRGFLVSNTRNSEIEFFADLASYEEYDDTGAMVLDELPLRVIVPAFVLSELKTAFQMGFLLFLPFLVIDFVVASILISMGMFMLPPVMISTPFKILLFVLVDGWHIVCESLITSFAGA